MYPFFIRVAQFQIFCSVHYIPILKINFYFSQNNQQKMILAVFYRSTNSTRVLFSMFTEKILNKNSPNFMRVVIADKTEKPPAPSESMNNFSVCLFIVKNTVKIMQTRCSRRKFIQM